MKVRFRAKASADLNDIFDYGARQHGIEVADSYAAAITTALERLSEFPQLGTVRPTRPPLRSYPVGEHRIFYLISSGNIWVVRVLHKAMDVGAHL